MDNIKNKYKNNTNNEKLKMEKKFNKILEYLIIILVFLIPITRSGLNIFSFFLLLVWIVKNIFCPHVRKYNLKYKKWLFGYGFFLIITTLYAYDTYEAVDKFISVYLKYIIIFLITLEIIINKKQMKKIFIAFFSSSFLVYGYGFYQYFSDKSRIYSSLHNPNPFGSYLLICIFLSLSFAIFAKKKKYRIISYIYMILGLILLILTYSRGAWLGLIGGLIILFYMIYKFDYKNINFKKTFIILFLIVLVVSFSVDGVTRRMKSIFDLDQNSYRLMQYQTSFEMIKDKPIFGFGLGNYPLVFPNYKPNDIKRIHLHVHNIYFHWVVETGVISFAFFIIMIYKLFIYKNIYPVKKKKWFNVALLAIITGFAIHNFFDVTFLYSMVGMNIMIFLAIWINIINESKEA